MTSGAAIRLDCPVCGARAARPFYRLDHAPVTCTSIFDTPGEAGAVPLGIVDLATCTQCGFVFNRTFDAALGDLGAQYESSQGASAHFSAFARSLATEWVERHGLKGRHVLEVGSGSGHFLEQMFAAGIGSAIAVDPLAQPLQGRMDRLALVREKFEPYAASLQADALVCRHTLEHVPDVGVFLRSVAEWAAIDERRVVLLEIPDAERVFKERAFWDVYYEHCNYFSPDTLRSALELAGLEVLSLSRAYGDQYLLAEARISRGSIARPAPGVPGMALALCEEFAHDVTAAIARGQASLDLMARQRPVVVWQGAAKTVGFLTALRDASVVGCAVDASPARHGKFLPGSALPVHDPRALSEIPVDHIVLMNPVYLAEVREQVQSMGVGAPVHSVNDLLQAS